MVSLFCRAFAMDTVLIRIAFMAAGTAVEVIEYHVSTISAAPIHPNRTAGRICGIGLVFPMRDRAPGSERDDCEADNKVYCFHALRERIFPAVFNR